jgi:Trk K+ transport system NAD-binding subunit
MHRSQRLRKLNATLRDSWLLFLQFRWPVFAFCIAIVGGGILYYFLALRAGEPEINLMGGIYHVLSLTFLQPLGEFPQAWYLEIFYFIMPLIGLIIIAQGIADFGYMFFNRRTRRKEGVPVIQEDATRQSALESAGIARARSIIVCTQNDSMNQQIAVKARSLNPGIHVVMRIFDDDFAHALHEQFSFTAMSSTGMAAPAFAAAAAGVEMTKPVTIEGHSLSLARLEVMAGNNLPGMTVGQIEKQYEVSVIILRQEGEEDLHPSANRLIHPGDTMAILGKPEELNAIIYANGNSSRSKKK